MTTAFISSPSSKAWSITVASNRLLKVPLRSTLDLVEIVHRPAALLEVAAGVLRPTQRLHHAVERHLGYRNQLPHLVSLFTISIFSTITLLMHRLLHYQVALDGMASRVERYRPKGGTMRSLYCIWFFWPSAAKAAASRIWTFLALPRSQASGMAAAS